MYKLFIPIAFLLPSCRNSADITKPAPATVSNPISRIASLPDGFTIVEKSPDGYFIRLSSSERASLGTIRQLADSLSGIFGRIDLCLDVAHERGDEYLSIDGGKVFDYENNRIYKLNKTSNPNN